ncbi:hypothetical protein T484DRAFT_1826946, partial [Baffinella frigidus]
LCPASPDAYHTLGLIYEEDSEPAKTRVYHTLGLIYEEDSEPAKALEFYIIAAHLTPRDPDQWRRLAEMSRAQQKQTQWRRLAEMSRAEQKQTQWRLAEMSRAQQKQTQAIYCLNRALETSAIYCLNRALKTKVSPELLWEKQVLLVETGQLKKAIETLTLLLKKLPEAIETLTLLLKKLPSDAQDKRTEACKELARLYHQFGQAKAALTTLEEWWAQRKGELTDADQDVANIFAGELTDADLDAGELTDADLDAVNILAECYINSTLAAKCLTLIEQVREAFKGAEPIDLSVNPKP